MAQRVKRPRRTLRPPRRSQPHAKPATDRVLRQSVKNLEKELRKLAAVSDKALRQFEAIRLDGASRYEEQLVRRAVKDGLFADLAALEPALTASVESCPNLVTFRSVPAALLIWASTELHLEPIMTLGDEGEMSADAVGKYDWTEEIPAGRRGIVAYRVVAPGWKWRGRVLARPKLSLRQ
jgi:hypothetical protein